MVVVGDWHAALWLDDGETIALYSRVREAFDEAAVYGTAAQRVISRARRAVSI
ncbi:hypothetical protein QF034_004184 [Streptomyces africanus]|uniref:DUF5753 domain-containing protein n=1 Tax=Streptomyces africanus TaxID=231024 RepID=A0ABU0QRE6_9ACTN|nr:hypothetical protein [Streptomyces africanus]MDQ0749953.1 hypothetical protein [Streptomyces africanus]